MKRIISIVVLLAMAFAATAQHDTLPYYIGVPQFYMEHQIQGALFDTTHDGVTCQPAAYANLLFHYSDEDGTDLIRIDIEEGEILHVIGLAAILVYFAQRDDEDVLKHLYSVCAHSDSIYDSVRFRLYRASEDTLVLLKSVVLDTTFDFENCRFIRRDLGWNGTIPSLFNNPHACPVLEVYFDEELDLGDSLFVDCGLFFSPYCYNRMYRFLRYLNPVSVYAEVHTPTNNDSFIYPEIKTTLIDGRGHRIDFPYAQSEFHGYPLIFPIIRRDCDTCPTVQGLEYTRWNANQAYFRWQAGTGHRDWQLSYGPEGTAPEDGTIVNCHTTMSNSFAFNPDSHYVAYVRARCRFARFEYGPWSAPLHFCLNDNNGIGEAEAVDVALTPNPAANKVTVAAEGMESVELVAVDGATVLRRECRGECTIDLAGLAGGTYMVRVVTAKGVAARKLVVQR